MNEFEKVDKLRERANVTYEEARDALEKANGDLLDARVILEQQGKATQPQVSTFRTTYEDQTRYEKVERDSAADEDAGERFSASLKRFLRTLFAKLKSNEFCAYSKNVRENIGNPTIQIPLWLAAIILLICWEWLLPLMVILLFFGWRYRIQGKDDLADVNEMFDRASDMARSAKEHVKEEWGKTGQ